MNRFETLWKGYQDGLLQEAELAEFLQLLKEENHPLADKIDELLQNGAQGMPAPGEKEIILRQIRERMQPLVPAVHRVHFLKRYRWAAAALILLTGLAAVLFTMRNNNQKDITGKGRPSSPVYDAAPGKNGAVLTLADGSTLQLDSAGNGTVATQGNTKVVLNNGQLSYEPEKGATINVFNTMTTPRGRQFQLMLPDGSKVWLNAASSITYPVSFTAQERKVTITGEAYFEVSHAQDAAGKRVPFLVNAGVCEVEVLGTHFNVNAYNDEASIKTTLLEGKVKVTPAAGAQQLLLPGQQAIMYHKPAGETSPVQTVDVDQVIAWKNGLFNFHKADLPTLMRQLSRWYDVEVVYQGTIPGRLFGGEIERNLQLSQVLKILSKMGVICTIEGKKLIVQAS